MMQRFTEGNTVYYNLPHQRSYWRIEWVFINAGGLKYVDGRCTDDVPLQQLLEKYLNPNCTELVPNKSALRRYHSIGADEIKVLHLADTTQRSGWRYCALDLSKTLKENLLGKPLQKSPCMYVFYDAESPEFDSDDDEEAEANAYQMTWTERQNQNVEAVVNQEVRRSMSLMNKEMM